MPSIGKTVLLLILHYFLHGKASAECSLYESPGALNCLTGGEVTERLRNSNNCWVVEFYSNWCGHCQYFAPTWKQIAQDVEGPYKLLYFLIVTIHIIIIIIYHYCTGWKPFLRLGVVNCADSKNNEVCRQYNIVAYPTIKVY